MANVVKGLIVIAALGFLLSVVSVLFSDGRILKVTAEGFSRGSTNLALIAIALSVGFNGKSPGS